MYDSFKVRERPLIDDTWHVINRGQTGGWLAVHYSFLSKERVRDGKKEQSRAFKFYNNNGKCVFIVQVWKKKK